MTEPAAADFTELARQLHEQPDVPETLGSIVAMAMQMLEADHCGVMLLHGGNRVEAAEVSDDVVAQADELQLSLSEGPCLETMEGRHVYVIGDTETEQRWPNWCRGVLGLGIRSVLSVRLFTHQNLVGSLNVYSRQSRQFGDDEVDIGVIFAGHAAVALEAAQTESGLREALDGRHQIGLAQGILMERYDLSEEQAFSVLRRYSQDRNTKLRGVAQYVVEHRELPTGQRSRVQTRRRA